MVVNKIQYKQIALSIVLMLFTFSVMAQDEVKTAKPAKTRNQLKYFKYSDDAKTLVATISTKKARKKIPVKNVLVIFHIVEDTSRILLGNATTNEKGEAVLTIPAVSRLQSDSLGDITFISELDGK